MTIKILNKQTVKLTISHNDMQKYNITHDLIKNNEKITKSIILKMLENHKEKIEIEKIKNNIFIESFKTKEKGYVIYMNLPIKTIPSTKNEKKTTPIISVFKNTTNLKNLCKSIKNIFGEEKFKSSLYELNEKLVLIVETEKKEESKITALVREFSQISSKGEIKNQMIIEHYKPIYEKNAMEQILKTTT